MLKYMDYQVLVEMPTELLNRLHFCQPKRVTSHINPGHATTMKGLLTYSNDFEVGEGLNQYWYKDISRGAVLNKNIEFKARQNIIITKSRPRGSFGFAVPLNHIFGFCEDYKKV